MPNRWRYTGPTRGWEQAGVDWDNAKPIEIWHRSLHYVVFKVPGGKHWRSILEPSVSHPGSYVFCKILEDQVDTLITEELLVAPLSKRGRPV